MLKAVYAWRPPQFVTSCGAVSVLTHATRSFMHLPGYPPVSGRRLEVTDVTGADGLAATSAPKARGRRAPRGRRSPPNQGLHRPVRAAAETGRAGDCRAAWARAETRRRPGSDGRP